MKGWVVYTIAVTIVAVAGVSFAVGVVVTGALDDDGSANVQATEAPTERPTSRPTSRPTPEPTEYAPRLTGAEAAGLFKAELRNVLTSERPDLLGILNQFACDPEDYNTLDRTWIVRCTNGTVEFRGKVSDETGEATPLG
jgi:hypothetical protein